MGVELPGQGSAEAACPCSRRTPPPRVWEDPENLGDLSEIDLLSKFGDKFRVKRVTAWRQLVDEYGPPVIATHPIRRRDPCKNVRRALYPRSPENTGDLFILVYSIDSRESFDEVKRLQEQVWESKGQHGVARRKINTPMVIVANKCDRESHREIGTDELLQLVDGLATTGSVETSAKKNINIEEIFLKLFMLAKLPTEMSPSLHRKVQPSYVGSTNSNSGSFRRGVTIRRRLSDACGAVAPNTRRPSIRTDLLILQTKRATEEEGGGLDRRDSKNCTVQ